MSIVTSITAPVHCDNSPAVLSDADFRAWQLRQAETFAPSPDDMAFWLAFELARDGEPGRPIMGPSWTPEVGLRWARGDDEGRAAKAIRDAGELGRFQFEESGITEPPPGFSPAEIAAWREGFALAQADEDFADWLRSEERRRALDGMSGGDVDRSEMIEAVGSVAASRIGGGL